MQCTRLEATCKDVKLKEADGGTVFQSLALDNEIYRHMEPLSVEHRLLVLHEQSER